MNVRRGCGRVCLPGVGQIENGKIAGGEGAEQVAVDVLQGGAAVDDALFGGAVGAGDGDAAAQGIVVLGGGGQVDGGGAGGVLVVQHEMGNQVAIDEDDGVLADFLRVSFVEHLERYRAGCRR